MKRLILILILCNVASGSFVDRTAYIQKFTGTIIYVTKAGNDSNSGKRPGIAMLTIAAAETAAGASGMIVVGPGTYTESVTLSEVGTELWGEIGAVMVGTLTMAANSQRLESMIIAPSGAVGVNVDGDYCHINNSHAVGTPTVGYDVDGSYNVSQTVK